MLGWGLIGPGRIADTAMAPAINALPESRLVAVVSRDRTRAEAFAKKHNAAHAYTDYPDMLRDPAVDVVLITTPNALHADQVVAAARAGKHVLCDKPLATSAADAGRAVEECRTAGVRLGINFQTRHQACFEETKRLIDAEEIGTVLVAQVEVSAGSAPLRGWRTDPALAGLGSVNNIAVHAYDLLRYLLSSEVTEVMAMFDSGRTGRLETLALTLLRFENGTMAYVNANQKTPNYQADIDIYGTRGRIVGDHLTRPGLDGELRVLTEKGETVTPYSNADAYRRTVAAFNDAILHGREEPRASGLDGLRSVQLTEAIARSAREGVLVELRY
jgi:1,5-anhydro-D-fructose reductase (1,5-anhydro-D-mannitol-forming)